MLSVLTLAWYAQQDNPGAYEDWHTGWCNRALNDCLTMSHADVAKALYRVFWMKYVYSGDTQTWYEYRENHYYKLGKEPIPLRKDITSKFVKIFQKMHCDMSKNALESDSEQTGKKDLDFKLKALHELVMRLKNENYRSTIVKACKDNFHKEEFEKRCDKNHFLTALSNCVLEVVDKKVRPRPGKPEDFVLKYSEMEYPFEYTFDSYWVKEVEHWFDQITVGDRELKHYFLKRIASFLRGLNPEKLFDVWTNSGNNSKSMLTKTLQKMYGAYFVDFPVSLLASGGNKNSSGATPELAQASNSRAAILAEPDDRMNLSSGVIKRLTGGDRIFTRALHDNGGSMELTFKTIMVCNRIPTIASVDRATINRFVIMPFLGTWSEDAPESEEEQFKLRKFKMDPFFEAKIPQLAKALMWLSVQYYTYYANEGLAFPPIVKEYIKKHWDDNDHYLQFIAEKIDYAYKDKDKKEVNTDVEIPAQELYKFFVPWFKDYFPGMNVPTLSEFRDDISMSGRLGPQPKRGVWLGIKMKNIVPDIGGGIKL
jgi:phage/plasmid-associated DNA primase